MRRPALNTSTLFVMTLSLLLTAAPGIAVADDTEEACPAGCGRAHTHAGPHTHYTPTFPGSIPVLLVGNSQMTGLDMSPAKTSLTLGPAKKDGPLKFGETVDARAQQEITVERIQEDGRDILRRTIEVRRAGSDDVVMLAKLDMDPKTLLPLKARMKQGENSTSLDYDWENFTIRKTPSSEEGRDFDEFSLDMKMYEVGGHDMWIAALPLSEGYTARLPVVFGATGTKYWAVPRVVGSESIDLGDGKRHAAWVVELDWWGMGSDNTIDNYTLGGGINDTAGAGGKYWVLKKPVPGTVRVVRVRTEATPEIDKVIQVQ